MLSISSSSTTTAATAPQTIARQAAAAAGMAARLTVLAAPALPDSWTGKLWAMHCGMQHVAHLSHPPEFILFTDADISYAPEALAALVTHAHRDGLVLASLMAKLHCESFAERALIPAFIFFFQMLYPFAWVNRPGNAHRRRRGRLHAGAARSIAGGRRHCGSPGPPDRRLRAGTFDEGAGSDLAWPHPAARAAFASFAPSAKFAR